VHHHFSKYISCMPGAGKPLYEDDLSPEELETLRNLVREALGEDAEEQEELVLQLSAADLFEMIDELGLEEKITCEASSTRCEKQHRLDPPGNMPEVRLDLDDDDTFEKVSEATRTFLELEIVKLCKCVQMQDMSNSKSEEVSRDAVEEERQKMINASADGTAAVRASMTAEEVEAFSFYEELGLKNELHHKAILHSLTKFETTELFEMHGLSAPKEHDFEIVKQLLNESRSACNSKLKEQLKQNRRSGVTMRYVNNELVQTKDKYLLPAKDTEFIKATTCQLTLLGNSSKARREQRVAAEDKVISKTRK